MDSPIDALYLQQATDTVARRFPMFLVKLHRGVFWNYLEHRKNPLMVEEEQHYPCQSINVSDNNRYLLKVLYFQNRISVEFFHVLADGFGATEFLKSLLFYYLSYCGYKVEAEGQILLEDDGTDPSESEDSFKRYSKSVYYESFSNRNAYHIKGTPFEQYGFNAVHGVVSACELNTLAKKHDTTITAYLTALLIYSTYQTRVAGEGSKTPIVAAVPVNLRKLFPSKTLRNFFGVVNIGAVVSEYTTMEDLIGLCHDMLKHKTSPLHLQNILCSNVARENNSLAKMVPLPIKKWLIRLGFQMLGERKTSLTISNLGRIRLPESMSKYVQQVETLVYPSPQNPINCGISSVGDRLTITFVRSITEADILQYFFSYLTSEAGLSVELYSNGWGEAHDEMF